MGAGLRPGAKAPDEPPDPNGGAPAPDPTYLPLLGFLTFDRESEQYLCAALLRHGKAVASDGTVGLLSRLLPRLRRAFPRARILVRLDGGFTSPAVFAFLEAQPRLDYVIAMAKNAVLKRYAEPAMLVARARARTWRSEQTEHVYTETNEYQAGTWNHARRVVIKAEVVRHRDREPRDNPRFVVIQNLFQHALAKPRRSFRRSSSKDNGALTRRRREAGTSRAARMGPR